jgi:hypothetical protein
MFDLSNRQPWEGAVTAVRAGRQASRFRMVLYTIRASSVVGSRRREGRSTTENTGPLVHPPGPIRRPCKIPVRFQKRTSLASIKPDLVGNATAPVFRRSLARSLSAGRRCSNSARRFRYRSRTAEGGSTEVEPLERSAGCNSTRIGAWGRLQRRRFASLGFRPRWTRCTYALAGFTIRRAGNQATHPV